MKKKPVDHCLRHQTWTELELGVLPIVGVALSFAFFEWWWVPIAALVPMGQWPEWFYVPQFSTEFKVGLLISLFASWYGLFYVAKMSMAHYHLYRAAKTGQIAPRLKHGQN